MISTADADHPELPDRRGGGARGVKGSHHGVKEPICRCRGRSHRERARVKGSTEMKLGRVTTKKLCPSGERGGSSGLRRQ